MLVPAESEDSRHDELRHIEDWAIANNFKLNKSKSAEIIFYNTRSRKSGSRTLPPPVLDILRVNEMKVLGVTLCNNFSMSPHVDNILSSCAQVLYALKILRAHGMSDNTLN